MKKLRKLLSFYLSNQREALEEPSTRYQ